MMNTVVDFASASAVDAPPARRHPGSAQRRRVRVLWSSIGHVSRDRDFGRVEARVTVVLQYDAALPPRIETLLVGVPTCDRRIPGELRRALVDTTKTLAVLMHRSDRGVSLRSC